jgi:hypothetical protein
MQAKAPNKGDIMERKRIWMVICISILLLSVVCGITLSILNRPIYTITGTRYIKVDANRFPEPRSLSYSSPPRHSANSSKKLLGHMKLKPIEDENDIIIISTPSDTNEYENERIIEEFLKLYIKNQNQKNDKESQ